jgi:hypothetical protein
MCGPVLDLLTIDGDHVTEEGLQAERQRVIDVSETNQASGEIGRDRRYSRKPKRERFSNRETEQSSTANNPLKDNNAGLANASYLASDLDLDLEKEEYKSQTSTPIPLNDNLPENKNGLQKEALVELSASQQAAEFETFWSAYPRKDGYGAARLAYAAALKRAPAAELLAGAKRYAKAKSGEDLKFTKIPKNWLNEDGWRDELAKPSNVATGPWKLFHPAEPERVSTPEELAAREAQVEAALAARAKPREGVSELEIKQLARDARNLRHRFTVLPEKERKALGEEEAV